MACVLTWLRFREEECGKHHSLFQPGPCGQKNPEEIVDAPNGVRGIVSGDVVRRLVPRPSLSNSLQQSNGPGPLSSVNFRRNLGANASLMYSIR